MDFRLLGDDPPEADRLPLGGCSTLHRRTFRLQHLRLWGFGFGSVCWEGAGDGRSGTRAQGAGGPPAHPTCVCEGGRGGENLPVWGFPVHQKGSMALGAPGCGALSIRRQVQCRPRSAPCKRGAASFGCYGPSVRPSIRGRSAPDKEWATSAATALPQEGRCRVESRTSSIAWGTGGRESRGPW